MRRPAPPFAKAAPKGPPRRTRKQPRTAAILGLILVAGAIACIGPLRARDEQPVRLCYAVSLAEAMRGAIDVTLTMTGRLPAPLRLSFPGGSFSTRDQAVQTFLLDAYHVSPEGYRGRALGLRETEAGWLLDHEGKSQTRLNYRVSLTGASGLQEDIRHHLSVPREDGIRLAGFHLFLLPELAADPQIHVMVRDAAGGQLSTPWPEDPHLMAGNPATEVSSDSTAAAERPVNGATYRPRDAADLTNALLLWGGQRRLSSRVSGCDLRMAIQDEWMFSDTDLSQLLTRIAGVEIAFFGEAPHPAILCLVAVNPVQAASGFAYYGVHTGHSILLLLDPATTYADLGEKVASVAAHEMFHGWLGEAICQQDPRMLWFTEGATTWYTARMLLAAGIWTPEHAASVIGERIRQHYLASELKGSLTVAEAAAEIMQDGATVRYAYAGGCLAALSLDRWLAGRTGTAHPLDAVLRHLFASHRGEVLTLEVLTGAIAAVTGADSDSWLDRHVYGKETLPLPESLF